MNNLTRNNKNRLQKPMMKTRKRRQVENLLRKCFWVAEFNTRDKNYLDFTN